MTQVAPVNLPYSVKTLWFDPNGLELSAGEKVVVNTARGLELGVMASDVIEVAEEDLQKLRSPMKPIERIATPEDTERAAEMERLSAEAVPIFKELARETCEDMHPVTVEYMLDGDKAIFYFESDERVDFRELVRKLAARFHVRIDMRQIGVRDEARIVGGIAHCGQLVCCKRLGGEFKPVSIRMAKDQDLSLNPQKISGLCGRLMCCLRYEEEVYKEFKARAPKMNATIETPDGPGKISEIDVPRDTISVKVEEASPVKVPLSDFDIDPDDRKKASIDEDAWERAKEAARYSVDDPMNLLQMPSFTGEDKLGAAKAVHHEPMQENKDDGKKRRRRSRIHTGSQSGDAASASGSGADSARKDARSGRDGQGNSANQGGQNGRNRASQGGQGRRKTDGAEQKRTPRRRSTKIKADGSEKETTAAPANDGKDGRNRQRSKQDAASKRAPAKNRTQKNARVRPGGSQGQSGQNAQSESAKGRQKSGQGAKKNQQASKVRPGHKSSGLAHPERSASDGKASMDAGAQGAPKRRRRRRRSSGSGSQSGSRPASAKTNGGADRSSSDSNGGAALGGSSEGGR